MVVDVRQLQDFVRTARAYCAWAEEPALSNDEDMATAARLLARLCAEAYELPACFDDENAPDVPREQWEAVSRRFAALPFDCYVSCAAPSNLESPEPVAGYLAHHLTEIWSDLRAGLALYDKGNEASAAWEWRESFHSHWGRHATSALHAIHCWRT
ncbi:MAG: DUF5063 domain-containing protein [Xanthomonadales bacterium]|nr:DUF5063 domain-containing protein [Xanthomonadales bacterium]